MIKFRPAKQEDIKKIQKIEKEYYEGFNCPQNILKDRHLSLEYVLLVMRL